MPMSSQGRGDGGALWNQASVNSGRTNRPEKFLFVRVIMLAGDAAAGSFHLHIAHAGKGAERFLDVRIAAERRHIG